MLKAEYVHVFHSWPTPYTHLDLILMNSGNRTKKKKFTIASQISFSWARQCDMYNHIDSLLPFPHEIYTSSIKTMITMITNTRADKAPINIQKNLSSYVMYADEPGKETKHMLFSTNQCRTFALIYTFVLAIFHLRMTKTFVLANISCNIMINIVLSHFTSHS